MSRPAETRWCAQAVVLPVRAARMAGVAACTGLALAATLALAGAGAAWPLPAVLAAAALGVSFWLWRRRLAGHGVRAVRASAAGGWDLRRAGTWCHARLLQSWRGPGWLTLRLAAQGGPPEGLQVTVWRAAMRGDAWRRLNVLAAAREGA